MSARLRGARLTLLGLAIGGVAVGPFARPLDWEARAAERPARPARIIVEVARGQGAAREQEEAVVRGVVRVGAEVDLVRVEQAPRLGGPRFARILVRAGDGKVELDFTLDGAAAGPLATRALARTGSAAVQSEELALAVESALESALDAAYERARPPPPPSASAPAAPSASAPSPPAPPPSAPAPPKATEPREPTGLALLAGVHGGVGTFAQSASAVGRIGAEVSLARRSPRRPSLGLRVGYTPGFDAGERRAEAHASAVSLRLLPSAMILDSPLASLGLGLGVGVDLISVNGTSGVNGAGLAKSPIFADPVVSPTVMARLPLSPLLTVTGSFAVDVGFRSLHWIATEGGRSTEVFAPSHARPIGLLGLELALWDSARDNTRDNTRDNARDEASANTPEPRTP